LGAEVWRQTEGCITHFFAGVGTSGTISSTAKYLKERNPKIKVIGINAVNSLRATNGHPKPYKIEGIGIDFMFPILNYDVIDEIIAVSNEQSLNMLPKLARNWELLAGPGCGAVAIAVQQSAKQLSADVVAVMIFCNYGRAYLSKGFYGEPRHTCAIPT
jgi:cystathionine beta-synthase